MSLEILPFKCKECTKSIEVRYHSKCDTCQKIEFEESVFCELNRAVQELDEFECHSFEPRLEIVEGKRFDFKRAAPDVRHDRREKYSNLLNSDKIKYERALALQRSKLDPNAVFVQLKYHIAWNVVHRIPVFRDNSDLIESTISLFPESSVVVNDFVHLIFLAPDHVHLLIESNGELSIEEIINRIKDFTNKSLSNDFPLLKEKAVNDSIWDEAYFVETLG